MAEKYTYQELLEMWKRTPERQYEVAISKIIEAINLTNGQIYVSWSGGADSTFLLYLVSSVWKELKPNIPLNVVFADTTNECREIYKFVESFPTYLKDLFGIDIIVHKVRPEKGITYFSLCREIGIPLISKSVARSVRRVRRYLQQAGLQYSDIEPYLSSTKDNVEKLLEMGLNKTSVIILLGYNFKDGCFGSMSKLSDKWRPLIYAPFEVSEMCCDELKKKPAKRISKTVGKFVPMTGEKAIDSMQRKLAYVKTGCNAIDTKSMSGVSKPLGSMTEQGLLHNAKRLQIPMADIYGDIIQIDNNYCFSGAQRTGCDCCGFGITHEPDRFVKLYERNPAKVREAFKPVDQGGLGYKEAIEYLNKYCKCKIEIPQIE